MAVHKWSEPQIGDCEISACCEASKHRGMESKRAWGISLQAFCKRLHQASRLVAGGKWQTNSRPTISQICSSGDQSVKLAGQGSSDTDILRRRLAQTSPHVGLGGLVVTCSPRDPRFAFKSGWGRWIFQCKNPEHKSSGKDFKLGVPSLRFQAR